MALIPALVFPAWLLAATPAPGDEKPSTDAPAVQATAVDDQKEIRLPPGFKPKKRGKFVVYCRKESVVGTRFPAEKCYDETGIREYLRAQAEERERVDQMRRICGNLETCGGG